MRMTRHLLTFAILFACSIVRCEDLTPDRFSYIGKAQLSGVGMGARGLARLPSGNFVTIGQSGQDPFNLYEFSVPDDLSKCKIVRAWGPLNTDNVLQISGQQLVSMRGLCYDKAADGLIVSYGSFYANLKNNPVWAFVRLKDDGTKELKGPWRVADAIHSDTVKGCVLPAPCEVIRATSKRYLAFGTRGSTSQLQSWGTGLVALNLDVKLAANAEMPAQRLIHWPMLTVDKGVYASAFPREAEDVCVWMEGEKEYPLTTYGSPDGIQQVVAIGDSFLWTGTFARGRAWYGNFDDYSALPSVLDPCQLTFSAQTARGNQAEAYQPKYFIADVKALLEAMKAGEQRVGYRMAGDLQTLGGRVELHAAEMSGLYYDGKRLYGLNSGTGTKAPTNEPCVHVWEVQ